MSIIVSSLAVIGGIVVLYAAYTIYDFLSLHFIKPSRPLQSYLRPGPEPTYALITGASAGIGLGVAQELVKQGFGVILLGHLEHELVEAKQRLERATPGAAVRTAVMNAQTATNEEMAQLAKSLEDLNITILVNNVGGSGISNSPIRELGTYSFADIDATINLNARFMAQLTALILPILSRKPENPSQRSLVLSMSSGGWIGLPWLSMYCGTKAFNLAFSRSLAREFEYSSTTSHVDSLAVTPGDVLSQSNRLGVAQGTPTADIYGKYIISTVDGAVRRKKRDFVPYWQHDLQVRLIPWLDEGTRTREVTKAVAVKRKVWEAYYAKVE
ncbi:hypothetical protein FZEAL_9858 [Fusarium zealandicum]|uniref:NAD(P)-binding protein n=1 Tax=Fusarium zealandicum TaxID=1053134 RepID=A0A8H4U7W7_9HYPO|nr:hypothetical protein FZEAL_9858 [Fusarium zealandicum]